MQGKVGMGGAGIASKFGLMQIAKAFSVHSSELNVEEVSTFLLRFRPKQSPELALLITPVAMLRSFESLLYHMSLDRGSVFNHICKRSKMKTL